MKRILSKADTALFIIIIAIAVAGIMLMSGSGGGKTAVVRVDGNVERRVDLRTDQTFSIGDVMFEVKDGAIAFTESDCPDKDCIRAGWLRVPGASMACLPNRISVTVEGESESGVDAIAH
jgi:hypothetical protein